MDVRRVAASAEKLAKTGFQSSSRSERAGPYRNLLCNIRRSIAPKPGITTLPSQSGFGVVPAACSRSAAHPAPTEIAEMAGLARHRDPLEQHGSS